LWKFWGFAEVVEVFAQPYVGSRLMFNELIQDSTGPVLINRFQP
jgi:hypothetical protein